MTLRTTICHLTFSTVLLAPPRRPLDSGPRIAVKGMPSVAGITDGLAKATQEDENGGTPGGTTRGIASRVLGASNPRRNLFTLTSILCRQGRGGTPFGLAEHRWLGKSPSATSLLRPSAVVIRATAVGVAGRRRNSSRIGVGDMLSYQDWQRSCLPPPPWIPAPYRGTGHASDRRNDGWGAGLTSARAVALRHF